MHSCQSLGQAPVLVIIALLRQLSQGIPLGYHARLVYGGCTRPKGRGHWGVVKKHFLLFSIMHELILVLFNMGIKDPVSKK